MDIRLDPAKIADFTLAGARRERIPLSQVAPSMCAWRSLSCATAIERRRLPSVEISLTACSPRTCRRRLPAASRCHPGAELRVLDTPKAAAQHSRQ